jgi:hypothetical protein
MSRISFVSALSFAAAAFALAGPAHAQTVIGGGKGGVTFPITITQSGSYKLAGNLNVPAGSGGIVIGSGLNVTLDLGGYQVTGPLECNKGGCNATSYTTGIRIGSSHVRIHSGAVQGFGSAGISLENGQLQGRVVLEDIAVTGNMHGVYLVTLQATRVTADNNAFHGIYANRGVIVDSIATNNGGSGFKVTGGVVRSSAATQNGKYGFEIEFGVYDNLMSHMNGAGNSLQGTAGVNGLY